MASTGQSGLDRQVNRKGPWREGHLLGSGGFGTVVLWTHETTGEQVALKRCRVQHDLAHKHRHRWQFEVDIMKRLRHDNVVAAQEVPPHLDVTKDEMPLMAMEYCNGGDLRKILNKPENSCGMSEFEVRNIVHDCAAAVEYLHSNRIIHRDLKPENVVLQRGEERIVYKLIDLGYAKDLEQGSVCTSFVGTLQYLAPELFADQKYTQTVDFWSFGVLMFECITGYRPFLTNLPPVQWHRAVCNKSPDDIVAIEHPDGEVKFSSKLPKPNNLNRILLQNFESWLRLMLRWDPKSRGGGLNNDKRPKCFASLNKYLGTKIVNILNVPANEMLSYPVPDNMTMLDVQRVIEQETSIPVSEQDIVMASGLSPEPMIPAAQCWSKPSEEESLIFLYRRNDTHSDPSVRKTKPIPVVVQAIIKEPHILLSYPDQKKAWAQSVHFCHEQCLGYKRLMQSQKAIMLSLLRMNSTFLKMKTNMTHVMTQLMAKVTYFTCCLDFDVRQYEAQAGTGISYEMASGNMLKIWNQRGKDVESYRNLNEKVGGLEEQCSVLQTKIVELQRSPFARSKQNDVLEDTENRAKRLYQELRQTPKENRGALTDHNRMVQLLAKCLMQSDRSISELYMHLGKISLRKHELEQLSPFLTDCQNQIEAASKQIIMYQHQRQENMWKMLRMAVQKVGGGQAVQVSPAPLRSQSSSGDESLKLIEENKERQKQFEDMLTSINQDQAECLSMMKMPDIDDMEDEIFVSL